jgi:alkylation response protein AidB-like acyl-CoA dehydrogenase
VDLALTDEQKAVRDAFAAVFAKEASTDRLREVEALGFDRPLWDTIHQMGAIDVGVSADAGGGGGGLIELSLIAEEVGRRIASVPFAETAAAARLCAAVGADQLLGEILGGTALVSVATRQSRLASQLLIDGAVADLMLGLDGDQLVAHPRPQEIRLTPNLGGLPMAQWSLPGEATVVASGPGAVAAFQRACDDVRVLRAAALVGLTSEAIEIGVAYARERKAFGTLIGTFQAVAHPLADAVTANDGAQLLVRKAAWALDEGLPSGAQLACMAFVFAAETAATATQHSLHIHGGYGFMAEYDIQLYYRRAKAWTLAFADPGGQLLTLADRLFGPVS